MEPSLDQPYALERGGTLLSPAMDRAYELGGVLNPTIYKAGKRTLMMYRAVAKLPENFSVLALAELEWNEGMLYAKRLDRHALVPSEPYELLAAEGVEALGGGCEDPRVTSVSGDLWLCYTAYGGDRQARIGLAKSKDGLFWKRKGLARFSLLIAETAEGPVAIDLNRVDNKDAMLFPERINGRYVLMHRPMFPAALAQRLGQTQSIWISYSHDMLHWTDHQLVAAPQYPWERLKLGGGTQPVKTPEGWLIVYHGVDGERDSDPNRRYSAGAMVLALDDPCKVLYRSPTPILTPQGAEELQGVVNNVVFPTGLWDAPDGEGLLVAYGQADWSIGWARMRRLA